MHRDKLESEDLALRNAGVSHLNLRLVSGVYPPGCRRITRPEEGPKSIPAGAEVASLYIQESTNEPNRLVVAALGVAIPADQDQHGIMFVYRAFGETDEKAGEYVEDRAATRLADSLGIEFDPDTAWDEKEQLFKMSGKIVRTFNVTQSAVGNKDGLWTTVFTGAIFPDEA